MKLKILGCTIAALAITACGDSDSSDGPSFGKRPMPEQSPTPEKEPEVSEVPEEQAPEVTTPRIVETANNSVTLNLQENSSEAVKETAANRKSNFVDIGPRECDRR